MLNAGAAERPAGIRGRSAPSRPSWRSPASPAATLRPGPSPERRDGSRVVAAPGQPKLVFAPVCDYTTGYLATYGALLALARRAREGGSWQVNVSLCQSAMLLQRQGLLADFASAPERLAEEELTPLQVARTGLLWRSPHARPRSPDVRDTHAVGPADAGTRLGRCRVAPAHGLIRRLHRGGGCKSAAPPQRSDARTAWYARYSIVRASSRFSHSATRVQAAPESR